MSLVIHYDRSFLVNGPAVWNCLLVVLRSPDTSLDIFKDKLKTFLFRTVYWMRICGLGELAQYKSQYYYYYYWTGDVQDSSQCVSASEMTCVVSGVVTLQMTGVWKCGAPMCPKQAVCRRRLSWWRRGRLWPICFQSRKALVSWWTGTRRRRSSTLRVMSGSYASGTRKPNFECRSRCLWFNA